MKGAALLWRLVIIVHSGHEFGCNTFPNKGLRIISSDARTGLMRCTDKITEVCEAGPFAKRNLREGLSQLRRSPLNIRLRGGKGSQGDGTKKRQRKSVGAEEVGDLTVDNTKSILYKPGGSGFGKVEVVSKPQDNMMPDVEDFSEGRAPMFEVNLTEMRGSENRDDSGTDNNPVEYSHREWYSIFPKSAFC
jgi:hypothetical protein